jgi:hypothetical protein
METNPEEMKSEAEHEEAPKEEAAVKPVRALKRRHGDWSLPIRRHSQPKKRTQGDGGSWKKLVTAHKGMTHHAIPAGRKGHCRQGQRMDKDVTKNPERTDV